MEKITNKKMGQGTWIPEVKVTRKYCLKMAIMIIFAQPVLGNLIDFEVYSDGQNINGLNLGGVTLYSPKGSVEVYANNRLSTWYHSPVNSIANFKDLVNFNNDNPLRGVFDAPVTYVSLWAGDDGGHVEQWRLDAYDAVVGGNLVDSATSSVWSGMPYEQLSVSGAQIWRIEALSLEPPGIGIAFDDLEYMIPVPSGIVLTVIGAGIVGYRRRRLADR